MPISNELLKSDKILIGRIEKSGGASWRKPMGQLLVGLGIGIAALHILAIFLGVARNVLWSQSLLFAALVIMFGLVQIQEARYQRIISHLVKGQKPEMVSSHESEESSLVSTLDEK